LQHTDGSSARLRAKRHSGNRKRPSAVAGDNRPNVLLPGGCQSRSPNSREFFVDSTAPESLRSARRYENGPFLGLCQIPVDIPRHRVRRFRPLLTAPEHRSVVRPGGAAAIEGPRLGDCGQGVAYGGGYLASSRLMMATDSAVPLPGRTGWRRGCAFR